MSSSEPSLASSNVPTQDMAEANTPGVGRVLSAHGFESIPEAHCYLSYGHRVDLTRANVSPQMSNAHFYREWAIEPHQIGAHKLALHHEDLREWLCEHRDPSVSFEEVWRIREACILALGTA